MGWDGHSWIRMISLQDTGGPSSQYDALFYFFFLLCWRLAKRNIYTARIYYYVKAKFCCAERDSCHAAIRLRIVPHSHSPSNETRKKPAKKMAAPDPLEKRVVLLFELRAVTFLSRLARRRTKRNRDYSQSMQHRHMEVLQRFCCKSQLFLDFVNKIYLPCCCVVFFVVCPLHGLFSRDFCELSFYVGIHY